MSDTKIRIVETSSVNSLKYCLVGVPDAGLVGSIALSYIILENEMSEVGHLESDSLPPVIVVHKGKPGSPLRIYSKNGVAAVISEIAIPPQLIHSVARSIVDWAKSKKVELLIALSGIAVQNRLEIEKPQVYGVSSEDSVKKLMESADIEAFQEGFITGLHAIAVKECLKKDVPSLILLTQSHLRYPDPGAAASMVGSLNKLIGLKIDPEKLLAQEEEVRLKMRELMQRTQQQMSQVQKRQEQEIPLMYV